MQNSNARRVGSPEDLRGLGFRVQGLVMLVGSSFAWDAKAGKTVAGNKKNGPSLFGISGNRHGLGI